MVDELGNTLLHDAIQNHCFEFIKILIKNGANVNIKNKEGFTPLHLASISDIEIVKFLLDSGSIIDTTNTGTEEGVTAFEAASFHGFRHIANLLKKRGAKIRKQNENIYKKKFLNTDSTNKFEQSALPYNNSIRNQISKKNLNRSLTFTNKNKV